MPHDVKIPGLPKGWIVKKFHQSALHPRDAAVMCERKTHESFGCNYVSWIVNMIEGGCTGGMYYFTVEAALAAHNKRVMNIN